MGLELEVLRGILAYGFERPSIIQQKAIPALMQNRDVIAQAQSGTGKTATFSVAVLHKIDETHPEAQAIILAPTRELAEQIFGVISSLGTFTKVRIALLSGGMGVSDNIRSLREKPHVIVATPGRMLHLLRDAYLNPTFIKCVVMDEADQMLSADFETQVKDIIELVPEKVQIGLYTATITPEMDDMVKRFMRNPIQVRVPREELTLDGIRQYYIRLENEQQKFGTLLDLYSEISIYQMMIYCNSKRNVETLKRQFEMNELPCEAIHGQMSPSERSSTMRSFRQGDVRILVTTDLLCRGIDVQQVSLVINYDFPRKIESYIHRIGRSGRFGRKGYAINLITGYDVDCIRQVTEYYCTQIDEMPQNVKTALS
jgi:translation initiation factor 4A